MLLTSDKPHLISALKERDDEKTVEILESEIARGRASDTERLACGVMLLFPPFVDEKAAKVIFKGLLDTSKGFEAAVWDAYRQAVMLPDGDCPFEDLLRCRPDSAVAWYMLSETYDSREGEGEQALEALERSLGLRLFPNNINSFLYTSAGRKSSERDHLWQILSELTVNKAAELEPWPWTLEGILERNWQNLILGTRLTSFVWESRQERHAPKPA